MMDCGCGGPRDAGRMQYTVVVVVVVGCSKPKFHGSSSILVANVTWNLPQHVARKSGGVSDVLPGCYEETATVESKLYR